MLVTSRVSNAILCENLCRTMGAHVDGYIIMGGTSIAIGTTTDREVGCFSAILTKQLNNRCNVQSRL